MDIDLLNAVKEVTPDLNPHVCNGLATEQMSGAEQYINEVLECAAQNFPAGLTYDHCRRISPKEEFEIVTRDRDGKSSYEIARSDIYMVAYYFKFNDEEMYPRYLYLPFVDRGGLIHMGGKQFAVSPVVADRAFSTAARSMFIQLTRARLTFERQTYHFSTYEGRETVYVVYSWVHNQARKRNARKGPSKVVNSTMAHYLFVKYGVTQTFQEFAGAEVIIGTDSDITTHSYPKDDWVICTSTGIRPPAWRPKHPSQGYKASNIRLAIPRAQYTQQVRSLVAGFYYVLDHFPERFDSPEHLDDPWSWKVTLGQIIRGPGDGDGLLALEVDEHIRSLDEHLDSMVIRELSRAGIECNDIYELFMYVIETLAQQTATNSASIASMYGKRLITLRYLLFDIVHQINDTMFKLKELEKKRGKLTRDEVENLMNKYFKPNRINAIRNHAKHPEVEPINTSTDNIFFAITCNVLTQDSVSRAGGKKKTNLRDPALHLHASMAEVATYAGMPKSDPTGRSRINPCVHLDRNGYIERDPDKTTLLDHVQELISL